MNPINYYNPRNEKNLEILVFRLQKAEDPEQYTVPLQPFPS
jgi:hypothetical protein